jgi:hypothetical protein
VQEEADPGPGDSSNDCVANDKQWKGNDLRSALTLLTAESVIGLLKTEVIRRRPSPGRLSPTGDSHVRSSPENPGRFILFHGLTDLGFHLGGHLGGASGKVGRTSFAIA